MLESLLIHLFLHEHVITQSGTVYKMVHCEDCEVEYVYQMERTGTGKSSFLFGSERQAEREAWSAPQNLVHLLW